MGLSVIHQARQCPHVHCDEWAILATEAEVLQQNLPIWSCARGHHGPCVLEDNDGSASST
jgi:hypothetical protein